MMLCLTLVSAESVRLRVRISSSLVSERSTFLWIFVLALSWYAGFALAARVTLVPAHPPLLPVPLSIAIAAALVGAATLIWPFRPVRPA
jgi:hypothetical protein